MEDFLKRLFVKFLEVILYKKWEEFIPHKMFWNSEPTQFSPVCLRFSYHRILITTCSYPQLVSTVCKIPGRISEKKNPNKSLEGYAMQCFMDEAISNFYIASSQRDREDWRSERKEWCALFTKMVTNWSVWTSELSQF